MILKYEKTGMQYERAFIQNCKLELKLYTNYYCKILVPKYENKFIYIERDRQILAEPPGIDRTSDNNFNYT